MKQFNPRARHNYLQRPRKSAETVKKSVLLCLKLPLSPQSLLETVDGLMEAEERQKALLRISRRLEGRPGHGGGYQGDRRAEEAAKVGGGLAEEAAKVGGGTRSWNTCGGAWQS